MTLPFHILDVFTDRPFAGNPLAVVLDADGLAPERMQAVAREFNLSETVFVLTPRDPVNSARLRIFTPQAELPFAGHPTVGAAALIGHLRAPEIMAREELSLVIEEGVGIVRCLARRGRRGLSASFELPRQPEIAGPGADPAALAEGLGLEAADIGFRGHRPSAWSVGTPWAFAPVASRSALRRARPNAARLAAALGEMRGVFVYCDETDNPDHHIHARFFAPDLGVPEDPATGSAVAAFAGLAATIERPEDGTHRLMIEQGFDMGRPSLIALTMEIAQGALVAASVGGGVALVAEGRIAA